MINFEAMTMWNLSSPSPFLSHPSPLPPAHSGNVGYVTVPLAPFKEVDKKEISLFKLSPRSIWADILSKYFTMQLTEWPASDNTLSSSPHNNSMYFIFQSVVGSSSLGVGSMLQLLGYVLLVLVRLQWFELFPRIKWLSVPVSVNKDGSSSID